VTGAIRVGDNVIEPNWSTVANSKSSRNEDSIGKRFDVVFYGVIGGS